MTLEYILGVDPSAANTGWALLAPKDGVWDLVGYGQFSPKKIAEKNLKEFCTPEDIYRCAADEIDIVYDHITMGANADDCVVGIEKVAFFALNKQSMAVGISVGVAIQTALWEHRRIAVVPVVPTAWQAPIRVKGWSTKDCSAFLAQTVYGVKDASEDACDAIAVAHYIAHHRGYRQPFIDDAIHRLESGLSDEVDVLSRAPVEQAKQMLLAAPRRSKRLSGAFSAVREAYIANLKEYRKLKGLDVAQTKLRPDFNLKAPAVRKINDAFERAATFLEAYRGRPV